MGYNFPDPDSVDFDRAAEDRTPPEPVTHPLMELLWFANEWQPHGEQRVVRYHTANATAWFPGLPSHECGFVFGVGFERWPSSYHINLIVDDNPYNKVLVLKIANHAFETYTLDAKWLDGLRQHAYDIADLYLRAHRQTPADAPEGPTEAERLLTDLLQGVPVAFSEETGCYNFLDGQKHSSAAALTELLQANLVELVRPDFDAGAPFQMVSLRDGLNVAIVGSRKWAEEMGEERAREACAQVQVFVGNLPLNTCVVSGGAPGVDTWAEQAARRRGLPVLVFKADWDKHGKRAGFLRNQDIVDAAAIVVAFTYGSRGTANTIEKARKKGIPVIVNPRVEIPDETSRDWEWERGSGPHIDYSDDYVPSGDYAGD